MIKRDLPIFRREDRHKKVRMKGKWRKPKGIHSKMRHAFRGRAPVVNAGYRNPPQLRGTNAQGKRVHHVLHAAQVAHLRPEHDVIVIGASLGGKSRLALIEKLAAAKFTIINIKDPVKYAAGVNDARAARKKERDERAKKAEAAKPVKRKEEKAPEKTQEEKKEEERAEQEKVLTQRQ